MFRPLIVTVFREEHMKNTIKTTEAITTNTVSQHESYKHKHIES